MNQYLAIILLLASNAYGQQTVGLFSYDSESFNGYTLFSPLSSHNTYLIDNCGNEVHQWTSNYSPGNSVYLLENGNLMRAARVSSGTFNGGGIGGLVEEYNWDGDLIWSYNYATNLVHQHHDIEVLPNGNVLVLAWESKTGTEAINQGRNPSSVGNSLWPDHIIEVEKVGTNEGNIVWEWHTWDHLIQDYDSTKPNFGAVADHPELIDINYMSSGGDGPGGNSDWMHCNSVSYNESLDQIVISSRSFSEIWIIDHSTTVEEASDHSGGSHGKGGDLLYRYGNPQIYGRGNAEDQVLNGQHDAQWIPEGYPNAGKLMVFNNNGAGNNASSVDIFDPPVDAPGVYSDPGDNAYGPSELDWRYEAEGFYSSNISGAQVQPNGNVLICEGASGNIFEVSLDKNVVWNYVNPVAVGGILSQGANPNQNNVFRANRYAPDFAAFEGKDLMPGEPIELNPIASECEIFDDTYVTSIALQEDINLKFHLLNPFGNELVIWNESMMETKITIWNMSGKIMRTETISGSSNRINTSNWNNGVYLVMLVEAESGKTMSFKITKSYQ